MLRPSMGDQIPEDPDEIMRAFGAGWWTQNLDAAAELLERAGFTRQGNDWYMPNGERFSIRLMVEGDGRPVMTRAGTMIAQQWQEFGIDATTENAQAAFFTRRNGGDFEAPSAGAWRPGAGIPTSRSSSTAGIRTSSSRPAPSRRRATGSAGRRPNSMRSSRRSAPSSSTIRRGRARPRVRQAHGRGDADHPDHGLQRLHGDGHDLLGLVTRRRRIPTPIPCRTGPTPAT
jgi:hypothetical protein